MVCPALLLALAMSPKDFASLKVEVGTAGFSADQHAAVVAAAENNTFTSVQVTALLDELPFSNDKLAALKAVSSRLEEPVEVERIVDAFDFSADQILARKMLARVRPIPSPHAVAPPLKVITETNHCTDRAEVPDLEVHWAGAWTAPETDALVRNLEGVVFSSDRIELLRAAMKGPSRGLDGPQVLRLLAPFAFSSDMLVAVDLLEAHILGLSPEELAAVVGSLDFSKDRLAALASLRHTVTQPDLDSSHGLFDLFEMSEDKQRAREILDDARPRSALFGTVRAQSVVVVIEMSGSMGATGPPHQRAALSWLELAHCELERVLEGQLAPGRRFGLVAFSDSAQSFRPSLVVASQANREKAGQWLLQQAPHGQTRLYEGLQAALPLHPEAIYLLTDGIHTAETEPTLAQLAALAGWGDVPVHSIAVSMGLKKDGDEDGNESGDEAASPSLMIDIATQTGGSFRAVRR